MGLGKLKTSRFSFNGVAGAVARLGHVSTTLTSKKGIFFALASVTFIYRGNYKETVLLHYDVMLPDDRRREKLLLLGCKRYICNANSRANSLVWGSFRLAPIRETVKHVTCTKKLLKGNLEGVAVSQVAFDAHMRI